MKWLTPRFSKQQALRAGFSQPAQDAAFTHEPSRSTPQDVGGFRIGQNVTHAEVRPRRDRRRRGHGADARVQVNFGRQGVKWLAVAVAKLQAA